MAVDVIRSSGNSLLSVDVVDELPIQVREGHGPWRDEMASATWHEHDKKDLGLAVRLGQSVVYSVANGSARNITTGAEIRTLPEDLSLFAVKVGESLKLRRSVSVAEVTPDL